MKNKQFRKAAWIIRLIIIAITVSFFFIPNYGYVFSGVMSLAVSFFLLSKEKKYSVQFPPLFDFLINTLLLLNMFGYFFRFYDLIDHWDTIEHAFFGLIVGLLGYAAFVAFKVGHGIKIRWGQCFFVGVMFATLVGSGWEVAEYLIDKTKYFDYSSATNHHRLQWDNQDTMDDITANTIGSLVAGVAGYLIYRKKEHVDIHNDLEFLMKVSE